MLLWLMPPGMVFNNPVLCSPGKGEGGNPHIRWELWEGGISILLPVIG